MYFIFICESFNLKINLELEKFNKTFFTYSVIETIFLFGVSIIQFYYLRKSLEAAQGSNLNI